MNNMHISHKLLWIFLGIVVLLVGSISIYSYYSRLSHPDAIQSQVENSQATTTDLTAGPALSGVEGWKTYRNEKYGFSLQYPANAYFFDAGGPFKQSRAFSPSTSACEIVIETVQNTDHALASTLIAGEADNVLYITSELGVGPISIATTTTFIDGLESGVLTLTGVGDAFPYEKIVTIPLSKKSVYVYIDLRCGKDTDILSTFKFTQ